MDVKLLASNLGIDEEDVVELVELFVATSLSDIRKMKQGLEQGSSEIAAAAAHSIKGAAGNLGFNDVFEMAKNMETQAKQSGLDGFGSMINALEKRIREIEAI